MMYGEVVREFAMRTRKNLEVMEQLEREGWEVYEVTQLVNSMLGLLVFPQQEYVREIPRTPITELEKQGWPIPCVRGDYKQVKDLNQLIRYLRNAIAHFNVKFERDEQNEISVIRVWNQRPTQSGGRTIWRTDWEADLGIQELRGITEKFIDLLISDNGTKR